MTDGHETGEEAKQVPPPTPAETAQLIGGPSVFPLVVAVGAPVIVTDPEGATCIVIMALGPVQLRLPCASNVIRRE
jgi:hypothetical protein